MAGKYADLFGTTKSSFRVSLAKFDASGLSAQRTITLPDKSGTLAMLSDITGGSGDAPSMGQVLDAANLPVFL